MPGWKEKTAGVSGFADLPAGARTYIARLAELSGAPFAFISTGPERNETIFDHAVLSQCGLEIAK
jgi:adenylosuccinate synthase